MAEGGTDRSMSKTKSDPGNNSLYSRHSRNYAESVSVEIGTIMTRLGYGEAIRRWRARKYKERDGLENARGSHLTIITAGSKAEGLTGFYESDRDMLHVLNNVLCVETGINLHTIPNGMEVYRIDTRIYPGHCILFLERQGSSRYEIICDSLCDNGNGDLLLSSSLFLDELSKNAIKNPEYGDSVERHAREGPSLPDSFLDKLHTDRVFSLSCYCPSILQKWALRPRHWPSQDIVQKVASLGAYVTPVGFKGSECNHMEWRICFNTGETELVNNLNDTHAKVYVMLKMILKYVLSPCRKEITSYVMKNIILWQAERNPQDMFYARSLFYWLHEGLRDLKTAIVTKQLSYYMIPERNLMAASGLQDKQQMKWVADITDMMAEGPRVILRLPKIRQAIVASPEPMLWFSRRRMELEMLTLERMIRRSQCIENGVPDESDAILLGIVRRQVNILMETKQRMLVEGCTVDEQIDIYFKILE